MPRLPKTFTEAVTDAVFRLRQDGWPNVAQELEGAFRRVMDSGKSLLEDEGYVAVHEDVVFAWDTLRDVSKTASECWPIVSRDENMELRGAIEELEDLEAATTKEAKP